MTIKETLIRSREADLLGLDNLRVRHTERIRSQGELESLLTGYRNGYIFTGIGVRGEKVKVFYANCMRHSQLQEVMAKEMGGFLDEICWGQILTNDRGRFHRIILHQPPAKTEVTARLRLRRLINGIDRKFWDRKVLIEWRSNPKCRYLHYYPETDRLVKLFI